MNQLDFKGRTAIVTGGAQGIGLAIVKRLLDSGASVRIWDRDQILLDEAVSSLPGPVSGAPVDVTQAPAVTKAAEDAVRDFGKIGVLLNGAGSGGLTVQTVDCPVADRG